MVAILAIVLGALALQLAIGQAGRPASREAPASLRA